MARSTAQQLASATRRDLEELVAALRPRQPDGAAPDA